MTGESDKPKQIILDRDFIINNLCCNCSYNGRCDYQSLYPVPACALVDDIENRLSRWH